MSLTRAFTAIANRTSNLAGQPGASIAALCLVIVWAVTGPMFHYSEVWQLVINTGTTIVTFLMVFLIQNSQNRDAAAMQCKLDELIRAVEGARGEFVGIEHLTADQLNEIRAAMEEESGQEERDKSTTASASIASLLRRY